MQNFPRHLLSQSKQYLHLYFTSCSCCWALFLCQDRAGGFFLKASISLTATDSLAHDFNFTATLSTSWCFFSLQTSQILFLSHLLLFYMIDLHKETISHTIHSMLGCLEISSAKEIRPLLFSSGSHKFLTWVTFYKITYQNIK